MSSSRVYRLNPATKADIHEVFHSVAYIGISKDAFLAMTLKCPVIIKLKSFSLTESEELEHLLEMHWVEWKRQVYIRLKMFGICPWYFIKVRGTIHRYPVVPPYGSGYISTFLDKKHRQQYQWNWTDGELDKKMHFEVHRYPPTIMGEYTSPIISLLSDYRSLKIARQSVEIAWYNQARPQHILEYKPSRRLQTENETLVRFADASMAIGEQKRSMLATNIDNSVHSVKVYNAQSLVDAAVHQNNARKAQRSVGSSYLHSEKKTDQYELQNANLLDKIVPLPPDYVYKAASIPRVDDRVAELSRMLDIKASSIMDFPVNMMSGTTKTSSQAQNNLRNVNERVKDWIKFFKKITKNAFLLAYGDVIQSSLNSVNEYEGSNELYLAHKEVVVEMECTPVTTYDDLKKYVSDGIMSIEDFAKHAFNLNAIPETQITIAKRERPEKGKEEEKEEKEILRPLKKRK